MGQETRLWGRLLGAPSGSGGLLIRLRDAAASQPRVGGRHPRGAAGGLPIRRTLESRSWKFGCAPTPGGRISNPPQVANLPHIAPRAHIANRLTTCTTNTEPR